MKRTVLFSTMVLLAGSAIAADSGPKDEVKSAAKKLADGGSYSWKSVVEVPDGGGGGGGRGRGGLFGGPTEGKIGKDGVAVLTMTRGENTTEAVMKGDKGAVKTQEGWQSLSELTAAGGAGGGGGGRGRGFIAFGLRNWKAPAAQAEDLLNKTKSLKVADGAYSGDLTEEGAKSFLTFGGGRGGNGPEISGAKGSVKFWVKDGLLSKYQFKVQGTMSFNGNDIEMNRTTTVDIKDAGSTKVEVPEDAKKKLS